MARSDWKRPTDFQAPEGRRRVAMEVCYDGRAFCGWQQQENENSVQETLTKALSSLLGKDNIEVIGSGRTDSGVHAWGQVAHAEFDKCSIPCKAFCDGLNTFLPPTVRVKRSWDVEPTFHARFSSMAREYRYFFRKADFGTVFDRGLVTLVRKLPSLELLNSYARVLVGTHDFTTFASAKDICPSKFRDIYVSEFFQTNSMFGQDLICFKICGNAFLYHMVRSLVGTMLDLGQKEAPPEEMERILESTDRSQALRTAPADGLYLWEITYDKDKYLWFEEKYGRK